MSNETEIHEPPIPASEEWQAAERYGDSHAGEFEHAASTPLPQGICEAERIANGLFALAAENMRLQMEAAKRAAPEPLPAVVCYGDCACGTTKPMCLAKTRDGDSPWTCTLHKGHTGPHCACGCGEHNYHIWRAS